MSDREWTKVVNMKRQKQRIKCREQGVEKNKWDRLRREYPHIVLPNRAKRLQTKLNIDLLEQKLLSEEFINYQMTGWKYVKVLKPSDIIKELHPNDDGVTYSTLELNNGWGDQILFKTMDVRVGNILSLSDISE